MCENVTKTEFAKFTSDLINEIKGLGISVQTTKRLIKAREVREILNCSSSTLLNYRSTGILHPIKVGGTFYYDLQQIKNLLQ